VAVGLAIASQAASAARGEIDPVGTWSCVVWGHPEFGDERMLFDEHDRSLTFVEFRTAVEPGVLLRLEVAFVQKRSTVCKFAGKAFVGDKLAAEANFTAMIADPPTS